MIPIVFIHMGAAPPPAYARTAVVQARQWNPGAEIFFITDIVPAEGYGVDEIWVPISSLPHTQNSARFAERNRMDAEFRGGFWRYSTERLFVLERWMRWRGVPVAFHLEYDNMLYCDVSSVLGAKVGGLAGMAAPLHGSHPDGSIHMLFSVMLCKDVDALSAFLRWLAATPSECNEMERGGIYWLEFAEPGECGTLPTAPPGVVLRSEAFRSWIEGPGWGGVWDGAVHGQYLGGEDPRNGDKGPGFVNDAADYRVDQFLYGWAADATGRRYPTLMDKGGRTWPIYNLYIHCKDLEKFHS